MGINSYYFKNIESKLIGVDYYDFKLNSDNQGLCLDYATKCSDHCNVGYNIITDKMVLWFDVNQTGSTIDGSSIKSLVEWEDYKIKPISGFTLCDFGLTGVDNGRYDQLSGITVNITSGDTKVILFPVTGYTISESGTTNGKYSYPWVFKTGTTTNDGCDVGNTICLNGGFYQGYFKLDFLEPTPKIQSITGTCGITESLIPGDSEEFKYDLLPTEFKDGWSMETWIKWDNTDCETTEDILTLNNNYLNNKNFFFYIGTRAENKFRNVFSGETGLKTCGGIPLSPEQKFVLDTGGQSWFTRSTLRLPRCWQCCDDVVDNTGTTKTKYCDELSENALGFRITDDGKVGYRKMTVSVGCYNNKERITGTTMEEGYSDKVIFKDKNKWYHVVVTYTENSVKHGLPAGVLKFWVNGKVVYRVNDFIGLKLRALDEWSDKQLGVPFNISWGGGTQGLLESQTFNGPDVADYGLELENNFAGTFEGEISQLRFYEKPLNLLEIRNNLFIDCPRYCVYENFGGSIIIDPNSEFCDDCGRGNYNPFDC
jgi:hypothetical protein